MLQETNPKYNATYCNSLIQSDSGSEKIKKTNFLFDKKGPSAGKVKFGEKSEAFSQAVEYAHHWKTKYVTPDSIPDSEVPDSYDFRNIKEVDFTGPIRD